MTARLIGYARVSTDEQNLTAQRDGLLSLGVTPERIYVDYADLDGGALGAQADRARQVGITRAACPILPSLVAEKEERWHGRRAGSGRWSSTGR